MLTGFKAHSHLVLRTLMLSPLTPSASHLAPKLIYNKDFMLS